ncbi:ABC transporter substrate-binding protein [Kaistia sp. 32K]|uniref:TRAP transporter substrate-binding protein n=1 Tax=Kaistia sp. 32K TaxID=2795690 RepID=UPI001914E583|nr:ABC transporter substrate-binding protein [Kaistia sp. 32K]BCP55057.1 ABC transporter substrate-binding protein [Kaistia sp. 32K]
MRSDLLNRRRFLRSAGLRSGTALAGAALGAPVLATPALAQVLPTVQWRLHSDFPRAIGATYRGATGIARTVASLTDGRFQIEIRTADDVDGDPARTFDAVEAGAIEACHTLSAYNIRRDPAFAFGTALPFGLNARMQNAWIAEGGGQSLLDDFYASYNLVSFAAGNTGAQMGGWFRKEIKSLPEIAGMKMRIAGLGALVMNRLGVETQTLSPDEARKALESGAIDAAEFAGPAADEAFGFHEVAPYYYYPGWWEGGPSLHLFANKPAFEALPPSYQAALRAAAAQANVTIPARFDIQNNAAIRRLVADGVRLRPFPQDLLDAAYRASFELYAELAAKSPSFKTIYEPWKHFRDEMYQWYRVAEHAFDSFGFAQQSRGL